MKFVDFVLKLSALEEILKFQAVTLIFPKSHAIFSNLCDDSIYRFLGVKDSIYDEIEDPSTLSIEDHEALPGTASYFEISYIKHCPLHEVTAQEWVLSLNSPGVKHFKSKFTEYLEEDPFITVVKLRPQKYSLKALNKLVKT